MWKKQNVYVLIYYIGNKHTYPLFKLQGKNRLYFSSPENKPICSQRHMAGVIFMLYLEAIQISKNIGPRKLDMA